MDLFGAYGVAFAPLPNASGATASIPEITVAAAFRSSPINGGRLTLSLPGPLLEQMRSTESTSVRMDWARELANQLLGRIKNRLLPFGIRLELGLLTLLDQNVLRHQLQTPAGLKLYAGRTLRGQVLITAYGLPGDSALAYVGSGSAAEGAMLWL